MSVSIECSEASRSHELFLIELQVHNDSIMLVITGYASSKGIQFVRWETIGKIADESQRKL